MIGYEKRLDEIAPDRMSTFDKGLYDVCVAMNKDRGYGYFKSRVYRLIDDIETYLPKDRAMKIVKDVVKKGAPNRAMRLLFKQKQHPAVIVPIEVADDHGVIQTVELTAENEMYSVIHTFGLMLRKGIPSFPKLTELHFVKGCDELPESAYLVSFENFFASPRWERVPEEYLDDYLERGYYMYAFLPQYEDNILEWDVDDEVKIFLLLKVCEILDEYGYEIDKYCILPISKKNYL